MTRLLRRFDGMDDSLEGVALEIESGIKSRSDN